MSHRGTIPPLHKGESYPSDAKVITDENVFNSELYKGLKCMWNVKDADGNPKKPGECYLGVVYEPFKPSDMSIVDYRGRMTSENLAKFEQKQWNSVRCHYFVRPCCEIYLESLNLMSMPSLYVIARGKTVSFTNQSGSTARN